MKKGWKIFAIVCAVVAGIGITLCIAGFAIGATMQEVRGALDRGIGFKTDSHHAEERSEKTTFHSEAEAFSDIRKIDVKVGKVQVEVLPTDGDEIRVEHHVDDSLHLKCVQDGDTLEIKTAGKGAKVDQGGTVQVYIPRGLMLDEADFSIGAGTLKVTDFNTDELDVSCGAAAVHMVNIAADDVNIECGAGQVDYVVSGQEDDYNYKIEIGAGKVNVGGTSFSGLAVDKKIYHNANKNMSIECGAGHVSVAFEQQN